MIKKIVSIVFIGVSVISCVSSKVHKELEGKYTQLKRENRKLDDTFEALKKTNDANEIAAKQLNEACEKTSAEKDALQIQYDALSENYENLKNSYDALGKNSSAAIAANSEKNRRLLSQLEEKESTLANERSTLDRLQKDLEARSKRIKDLEELIATKDAKMQTLKKAISNALINFEGKGLTVEERNGKVYISMENKLLFDSGSWVIEGHTDNVPYTGNGQIKGNWDLSTKRATAIVKILIENKEIEAENLTAAGRGEYAPVDTNETTTGKAKNRRIEVILTPKLDQITKLLHDI